MGEIKLFLKKEFPVLIALAVLTSLFFLIPKPNNVLASEARKIADECRALSSREQCYAKAFTNLTKENDMAYAFAVLHVLQDSDPQARGCHFIAHSISIAETEKDPSKWREVMNSAPQDCSYGAAHGALEVHVNTFPDGQFPKSEIATICNNPDTNNCTHILGHLLLVLNGNIIPESLKDCLTLPQGKTGEIQCENGVFMERITALNLVAHGLMGKEANNWVKRVPEIESLCRTQSGTSSIACWRESVHVALVKFSNDPQKIVEFCESAPNEPATYECVNHAFGILAATRYHYEVGKMKEACDVRARASDFKQRCYNQLVSSTLATIHQSVPEVRRFCASLEIKYQQGCFANVESNLAHWRSSATID